ncbi:PD-(D/E)XK nuclease-like domain-containing protein [Chryseobacterium defluvii]|uniref:PDDEXK-like uncharacterized protein DUF3799 n=1 Tax=Chryseobacterium defluvii TaxID=160396 RepID=A0A495SNW1_9FLAO|nr:PD-(D/E)XK nuclease-like domain-containing protein [Chryseobacterium defluvii]RKT01054.1 PDDEXK-like uncharacterized protein DUF3799 [Chryseobacterium defluvii]
MKNTAIEAQEQEAINIPPIEQPDERSKREILIDRLIKKDIHMSYSKLKNLTSPINFMNALLQPKKKNAGMNFGSMVDCLVLEEDKFEDKFVIISKGPSKGNQEDMVDEIMKSHPLDDFDKVFEQAFKNNYKAGKIESVEHLRAYCKALLNGKDCVSQSDYDLAVKIADHLKNAPDVADELCICEEFQKMIRFEFMGWQFVAILDTWAPSIFHDMKFVSQLNPDKFKWEIEKYDYEMQIGVYAKGLEILGLSINPKFKYILYDDDFNYSVPEIEVGYIDFCKRKFEYYVMRLNKMVEEKAFDRSYDYFKSKNVIYKPQWAPGFDYTIFQNNE